MKITNLDHTPKTKVDMEGAKDAYKQVPISKNDGSPLFSFRVFTIEPKGHTPYHIHPFEHLNYVISGQGTIVAGNHEEHRIKKGDFALVLSNEVAGNHEEHRIKKGDFALVLSNEEHQYRNDSENEPLVLICAVHKNYE